MTLRAKYYYLSFITAQDYSATELEVKTRSIPKPYMPAVQTSLYFQNPFSKEWLKKLTVHKAFVMAKNVMSALKITFLTFDLLFKIISLPSQVDWFRETTKKINLDDKIG